MANDFKALIGIAYDLKQAQSELDRQIKSLQKNTKLALDIELSDKEAKKVIQDSSKMWSNYRKEAVAAMTAQSAESKNMQQHYKELEKQSDSFLKKNINGIDLEIKKREEAARIFSNQIKAQMQERISSENKLQIELKKTAKDQQDIFNLKSNKIQLDNRISFYLRENTKLGNDFKDKLIEIQKQIQLVDKAGLSRLNNEFKEISTAARSLGQEGQSLPQKFMHDLGAFTTFLSAGTLLIGGVRSIRNIISTVVELDKSIVGLQQATGYSISQTKELLNTYIDLGQELGATGIEVANAAENWLRQGKTIAETNQLIRDSMILSKIGQIDSAEATDRLTNITKGYKIAVEDTIKVVDKLSAVDMVSATNVSGLASAVSEVANNANIAGVSLDKLLGYVAVIGETTGSSMSSVGNSLSTIFSRMGNIKLSRLKDYDNNGEDLSNVETVLRGLDIQLRDSNKEFRNFGNVLDEVAGKWNSYDGVTQRAIASSMAGKDHMESFLTLMENYGKATEYMEVSLSSSGSAMEKFAAYEESTEAKTKKLQSSLQELSTTTLDSSTVKFFIDLANNVVSATTAIGGLAPVVLTLGGAFLTYKFILPLLTKQMSALLLAETGVTATTMKQIVAQTGLNGAYALGITSLKTYATAMKSFLLTNPVGWAVLATTVISGLAMAYSAATTSLKEQQAISSNLKTEYDELQIKLTDVNSELENTIKRLDELNSKDNLTIIEQAELEKLKETNTELESQNRLLKEQAEIKGRELANSVATEFKKDMSSDKDEYRYWTGEYEQRYGYGSNKSTTKVYEYGTEEDYIKNIISLYDKYNEKKSRGISLTKDEEDYYKKIRDDLVNIGVKINDYADRYKIDDEISQSWREFAVLIDKTLNPAEYKQNAFDEIYNSDKFKNYKKELDELAQKGKLSPEILYYNKQYEELLRETGLTASEAASHINAINKATEETSNQISRIPTKTFETLNESLDKLESKSKDTISSVGELNQVLYDQAKGEKLTAKEAYNLITKYPQLSSALEKITGGYIINKEAIDNVREAMINQEKANATAQLNMTRDTLNGVKDRLEAYGIEIEAITDLKTAMGEQDKLSLNNLYGTMEGWGFDDASKRITTPTGSFIAISQGEYDGIKSAYEEQKSIYDTLGKMGNLKERINGLSNSLLSDPKYGVTEDKAKKTDPIKEAFDLGINGITGKNDLDHQLATEKINLEQYYDGLEKINKATYGKHKDTHLENYRQYLVEVRNGRKKLDSDSIKSKFDDLKFDYDMGNITEDEYYKKLNEYNEEYYKGNKQYQDEYKKNLVDFHNWELKQEEKRYKNLFTNVDNKISRVGYDKQDILNAIDEANGEGTEKQYKQLIKLSNKEIGYYNEKKRLAQEELKNTDKSSERYAELEKIIQDCENAVSDNITAQNGWNKSILELPLKKLEDTNKELKKTLDNLNETKDDYDKIIGAVVGMVDDQIKDLNKQKKATNDYFDNLLDRKKEELDLLKKTNEAREEEKQRQQALYDLERAKNQKTNKVYRDGGFTYEADTNAIRKAQDTLDKLAFDKIIKTKETEIDSLEKAKESALKSYDSQIERLNDIKDLWSEIAGSAEKLANINLAESLFGKDWQQKILNGDPSALNMMKSLYGDIDKQITDIGLQIEANDDLIESIGEIVEAWQLGETDITTALSNIQTAQELAKNNESTTLDNRLTKLKTFADEYKRLAGECATALASVESDLASIKSKQAEINSLTSKDTKTVKVTEATKRHSGMELGYVGESSAKTKDAFRILALDKLSPDEIPSILKIDEAVLTKLQQSNVLGNVINSYKAGALSMANIVPKQSNQQASFAINGDIHLHEVQNVNQLSNEIETRLLSEMNQKLNNR